MDNFTDVLDTFLDLKTLQLHCCCGAVYQKYLNLCSEDDEGLTGLELHEGEYLMTEFSFLGELTL